jgi:hypothetical protein
VAVPVFIETGDDLEDDDDDLIVAIAGEDADVLGAVLGDDEDFGGGSQPVSSLTDDTFVAYFDRRAAALGATAYAYGAGSQPISSVVEIYGNEEEYGGILDNILEGVESFFSDMFQTTKKAVKKVTRRRKVKATPMDLSSSVQVNDYGGWTYQKNPDGSIVIVKGPKNIGKVYTAESPIYADLDGVFAREMTAGRSTTVPAFAPVTVATASPAKALDLKAQALHYQSREISARTDLTPQQKGEAIKQARATIYAVGVDDDDFGDEPQGDQLPENDFDLVHAIAGEEED